LSTKNTSHAQQRFEWLQQIACDHKLPHTAVRVGVVLSSFINSKTAEAWPGIAELMRRTGLSERCVQMGLNALTTRHLDIEAGGGRRRTNVYRLKLETVHVHAGFQDINPANSCIETPQISARKPRTGVHPNNRGNNRKNNGGFPARGYRGLASHLALVIGGDE
jgi:hypothetical protein